MTGRDFLVLANRLAAASTEAEWRSAVSRAYYGAFHEARQLLTELGFTVPRDDRAHKYLSFRLSNAGNPLARLAGSELDILRGDRNAADYDLHRPLMSVPAGDSVRQAGLIVQNLDALRQEPARSDITDAMKDYERDVLGVVTWRPPSSP
jgi:uncharacterized protein (UPF0332 family)